MEATRDITKDQWSSLKPQIRKHWNKITEADLDHLNGKADELINILRKRYGYGKAQAEIELNKWLQELEASSS